MHAPLPELQAWFQQQMTAAGDGATWPVEEIIEPSSLRSSSERLSVYQNAYVARLVECLQVEFPAVRHVVGDETFLQFAAAHVQRHPPHSYTLGRLGAEFAETLESLRPPRAGTEPDFADFLVELARYERTVSEVFDAVGPERTQGLSSTGLAAMSPGELAHGRLKFFPCVRLLAVSYPVHEYVSSVRAGQKMEPPAPRALNLVLHRRDYIVRRWAAPDWQFALLQSLQAGATIAAAVDAALAAGADISEHDLSSAFAEWTRAELFRSCTRDVERG